MFSYYLRLATLSLKKNPMLSSLMIGAIALGIGTFMTTLTVFYLMSGNPIPHKSEQLYAIQLDSWDPTDDETKGPEDVRPQLTYTDAKNLINSKTPAKRQVIMFRSGGIIEPTEAHDKPLSTSIRASYGSFFPMFDVPFLFGNGWSLEEDNNAAHVMVINKEINEKIFGGGNSVGQKIRMGGNHYEIIGVMDNWNPTPKFYDLNNNQFSDPEGMYIPFTVGVKHQFHRNGNTNCWKPINEPGFNAFLQSECVWIQAWAELENSQQKEDYLNYLNNYTTDQKQFGRFQRPTNNFISPVMEWIKINEVIDNDSHVLVGLSFMFLAVCLINTVGLLLSKFIQKSSEVSLKRALGADKKTLFHQYLVEVGLLGFCGGLLGLGLAYLGLVLVEKTYQGYSKLVSLDTTMIITSILVAIFSTIIAGLYPTWRICRIPPATHLKAQ